MRFAKYILTIFITLICSSQISYSFLSPTYAEDYQTKQTVMELYNDSYHYYETFLDADEADDYDDILKFIDYRVNDQVLLFEDQKSIEKLCLLACLDNPLSSITNSYYEIENEELFYFGFIEYAIIPMTVLDADYDQKMIQTYQKATEIINEIPDYFNDYQTVKYLHDYIVTHVRYNEDYLNSDANTAYGALIENTARCEGYTNAMMLLLDLVGIENTKIFHFGSDIKEEYGHIWNMVKIDGHYYHVDTTNDSMISINKTETNYTSYAYFMVSTQDILRSYPINDLIISYIPPCENKTYNYFYLNDLYFTSYDREIIGESAGKSLAKQLKNNLNGVSIKFKNEQDYKKALSTNEIRYLLSEINRFDESGSDYYQYYYNDEQLVITFFAQE